MQRASIADELVAVAAAGDQDELRLRAVLHFELLQFCDMESDPQVHLWLSQHLSQRVIVHRFSADQLERTDNDHVHCELGIDVRFAVPRHADGAQTMNALLAGSLNIDVYDTVRNSHKQCCENEAGTLRVPLLFFMALATNRAISQEQTALPPFPLIVAGLAQQNACKGLVHVSESSLELNAQELRLSDAQMRQFTALRNAVIENKPPLLEEIARIVEFYRTRTHPTWKCLRGIGCYEFRMRTGNTGPPAMFTCIAPPRGRADYYAAALRIVMRRRRTDVAHFVANTLDPLEEASILGEVLTCFIAYCAYVGDLCYATRASDGKPEATPMESFRILRYRRSGDCEDSALEILLESFELLRLDCGNDPALLKLKAIRQRFYAVMCLVGVSNSEINGDYAKRERMDAHMHSALIPKAAFRRWCAAGDFSVPNSLEWGDTDEALRASERDATIILEGTGVLDPSGRGEPAALSAVRSAVVRQCPEAFDELRRVYTFHRNENAELDFYQVGCKVMTPEFYVRGCGVTAFAPSPGDSEQRSYGVRFQSIVAASPTQKARVRLWAEPEIAAETLRVMESEMRDLHPVPVLEPASPTPDDRFSVPRKCARALQARLRDSVMQANNVRPRQQQQQQQRSDKQTYTLVYHCEYTQMTQERCDALVAAFQPFELVGADIDEEAVTPEVGGFRMAFSVRATVTAPGV